MTALNELIKKANQVVFLTGAGVSTASGIPDYRSKNGLYQTGERPEYLLSLTCLQKEPQKHYQFVKEKMFYPEANPNIIHQKMAQLCLKGRAKIVTQNVDGLHQKAGTPRDCLVEFHGNLYDIYCQKCGQKVPYESYLQSMVHAGCGGILRTNIVLYEEGIEQSRLLKALKAVNEADLIVVCGTSLVVYPFAGLLEYRQPQAKIVAVNREQISLPKGASLILADAQEVFSKIEI